MSVGFLSICKPNINSGTLVELSEAIQPIALLYQFRIRRLSHYALLLLYMLYILPGSIVMHDGHASYQSIDRMKESHEHYEVLHKYNFVSLDNPDIHTQTIESTWQKFKQANRRRGGTSRALFMQFLSEYLWKKKFGGSDALYYLWKQISEVFVCIDGEIVIRKVFDSDWNYDVFDD